MPEPVANMVAEGAHVEHDKVRPAKDLGVDPLEDEVFFFSGIKGYQKGVIDITIAVFLYSNDLALWSKLPCNSNKFTHVSAFKWVDPAGSKSSDSGSQVGCAQSSGIVSEFSSDHFHLRRPDHSQPPIQLALEGAYKKIPAICQTSGNDNASDTK